MKKIIKSAIVLLSAGLLVSCANGTDSLSPEFSMKAVVEGIGEKIEVNVYEAEYAEGVYWIIFDSNTVFINARGDAISAADISVEDKIEIFYNGQVMMSYPPQVYAVKVKKL